MMEPRVIEVVEYIDEVGDDDDGEGEYEVVTEIVDQIVMLPRRNKFSAVPAYEVGIGEAPPPFLMPEERAQWLNVQESTKILITGM